MSVERIIGIDFGTSTSVIRVKRYNNGQPVDDRLSEKAVIFNGDRPMVPTLIRRTDKGTYYGYEDLTYKKGETLFQNFKVDLENPDYAKRQEARALTEEYFAYLAKEYRSQSEGGHFGASSDVERTIISYPVKWRDETKDFMVKAAEKAGFKNVEGMNEAQAAIHAVTVQSEDYLTKHGFFMAGVPCNILLMDMGAGTTDLVLCRHTPGNPPKNEMICTWPKTGATLFGGSEVDEILREYIRSLLPEERADEVLKKNGMKEFKTWKETVVSPALMRKEKVEEFSNIDNALEYLNIEIEPYDLDCSRFEKLAKEYLQEFPRLIKGCIDNSGIHKEDIDLVILTGGHSQWYFVKEMLADSTKVDLPKIHQNPNRVIQITRPQETVALGMVYRQLSAEFQKGSEPVAEEMKVGYEKDGQKETYISAPTIEASVNSIAAEYYLKNVNSLITHDFSGWIVVEPSGNIACYRDTRMWQYVKDWRSIVSISCGMDHIVGLTKHGIVVASGEGGKCNAFGQCDVKGWRDIVSISCGIWHTVGLKKDGTVVATGENHSGQCDVKDWGDIVSISCGALHTVGLKKDGTVVATGENHSGQCDVKDWRDIISISCGGGHTVGLRKDGTVIAAGENRSGECDIENWRDIISISCGERHTVGLRKDGTVVLVGRHDDGRQMIENCRDIVAVCGAGTHTCVIRSDGRIIYSGVEARNFLFHSLLGSESTLVKHLHERPLPIKLF